MDENKGVAYATDLSNVTSAEIVTLVDINDETKELYPTTVADAVFLKNGNTIEQETNEIKNNLNQTIKSPTGISFNAMPIINKAVNFTNGVGTIELDDKYEYATFALCNMASTTTVAVTGATVKNKILTIKVRKTDDTLYSGVLDINALVLIVK